MSETKKSQKKSNIESLKKPEIKFKYLGFQWHDLNFDSMFVDFKSTEEWLHLLENQVIAFFAQGKPDIAKHFDMLYGEVKEWYEQWKSARWLDKK